jgi:hypothetical protein
MQRELNLIEWEDMGVIAEYLKGTQIILIFINLRTTSCTYLENILFRIEDPVFT